MKTYFMEILVNCSGHIEMMSVYIEAKNFIDALETLRNRYGELYSIVKVLSITVNGTKVTEYNYENL